MLRQMGVTLVALSCVRAAIQVYCVFGEVRSIVNLLRAMLCLLSAYKTAPGGALDSLSFRNRPLRSVDHARPSAEPLVHQGYFCS